MRWRARHQVQASALFRKRPKKHPLTALSKKNSKQPKEVKKGCNLVPQNTWFLGWPENLVGQDCLYGCWGSLPWDLARTKVSLQRMAHLFRHLVIRQGANFEGLRSIESLLSENPLNLSGSSLRLCVAVSAGKRQSSLSSNNSCRPKNWIRICHGTPRVPPKEKLGLSK